MPRASWKGFLRLSLVSCPVYLTHATTRTKAIRLHQVWVPGVETRLDEPAPERRQFAPATTDPDDVEEWPQQGGYRGRSPAFGAEPNPDATQDLAPATRISL